MNDLFHTVVLNFCKKMGFMAVTADYVTPTMRTKHGAINLWAHMRGMQVAQIVLRFPHVEVYGTIYDDGGIRFDLKGKFDIYDPGSFRDLRQCLLDRVTIKGYALEADV